MRRISTRVDDDLHARFKGWCDENGTSMQKVLESFISKKVASEISEPRYSKGFNRLFAFKPHEVLKRNGIKPQDFLHLLEELEENFKKAYNKPILLSYYGHLSRLLRAYCGKKINDST